MVKADISIRSHPESVKLFIVLKRGPLAEGRPANPFRLACWDQMIILQENKFRQQA
jgi:hypothetical protein